MSASATSSPHPTAPDSALWRINREQALLLTGGRVLLMQIAHPMVAEAVYQHSYVFQRPLLRLHRTLKLTRTMVFGTPEEVAAAVAEIEQAHRPAVGQLEEAVGKHAAGSSYNARNPRQALWVFATLVEGAIFATERFIAPVDPATKQEFYIGCAFIAEKMGIPGSYLPADYEALLTYMEGAIQDGEVAVGAKARKIAPFLTGQTIPILRYLAYPAARLSVGLLPDLIREQYGYQLNSREARLLDGFSALTRQLIPYIPALVRYAPEYRQAIKRPVNEPYVPLGSS